LMRHLASKPGVVTEMADLAPVSSGSRAARTVQ
jgi:hypothetical protein